MPLHGQHETIMTFLSCENSKTALAIPGLQGCSPNEVQDP